MKGPLRAFSLILSVFALLVAMTADSYARRGGWGGGGVRSYQRQQAPRPRVPSQVQAPRRLSPSTPIPSASRSSSRATPGTVRQNSAVTRAPAFSGAVTKAGSPILAGPAGKKFSVPQQGVFSTRMSLLSSASRTTLVKSLGDKVQPIKASISSVAKTPAFKAAKIPLSADQVGRISYRSSLSVNRSLQPQYKYPPYAPGRVAQFTTKKEMVFYRVYNSEDPKEGKFLLRSDDIKGMSAQQIKERYALPKTPDVIAKITVPANAKMRMGVAAGKKQNNPFGQGGGQQFELVDRIDNENFQPIGNIDTFAP